MATAKPAAATSRAGVKIRTKNFCKTILPKRALCLFLIREIAKTLVIRRRGVHFVYSFILHAVIFDEVNSHSSLTRRWAYWSPGQGKGAERRCSRTLATGSNPIN